MFTKCMDCRKWATCPYCGTCHACRPDVATACSIARSTDRGRALLSTQVARKHQASTYTQDPGIGANGCEPRVSPRWHPSPEAREWARVYRDAARDAAKREESD